MTQRRIVGYLDELAGPMAALAWLLFHDAG
jgi:hypothetical protein